MGDNGNVLGHCHAGCEFSEIVASLGLEEKDFSKDTSQNHSFDSLFGGPRPTDKWKGKDITEVYQYQDEKGDHLFDVCRTKDKDFPMRLPNGRWGIGKTRRVPYRLPQILKAVREKRPVYIVEGEKDAHTLVAWGLIATCCPGGAGNGKWKKDYSEHFKDATVVIPSGWRKAAPSKSSCVWSNLQHSRPSQPTYFKRLLSLPSYGLWRIY
jgi:hypothetical protein